MGFGPYEAGGLAAFTLLGYSAGESMLSMLAMHIYSQLFDYSLGLMGIILFLFLGYKTIGTKTRKEKKQFFVKVSIAFFFLITLGFFAFELRSFKKLGALAAPPKGEKIAITMNEQEKIKLFKKENWFTPHILRYTYATKLYLGGMPLLDISKALGHNSIRTTQIYLRIEEQQAHKSYLQNAENILS